MKNIETVQNRFIQVLRFLTSPRAFIISLTLGIILILASPIILMTYVFWDFDTSSDAPVIIKAKTSPDKNFTARHYSISGGGAAGYATQFVNIQHSTDEFNKSKDVILQISHSEIISLQWRENNLLVVEYLKGGNISLKREVIDDQTSNKILFVEK